MRYYAGIGSRRTPEEVCDAMRNFATVMAQSCNWCLRSGHAEGADMAFEGGVAEVKPLYGAEIYLPWPGFNGPSVEDDTPCIRYRNTAQEWTKSFVWALHPNGLRLSPGAMRLHMRNVHQVLGWHHSDTDTQDHPSTFVLCWTPAGAGGGGTGMAIRVADDRGVPVFDLGRQLTALQLGELVELTGLPAAVDTIRGLR